MVPAVVLPSFKIVWVAYTPFSLNKYWNFFLNKLLIEPPWSIDWRDVNGSDLVKVFGRPENSFWLFQFVPSPMPSVSHLLLLFDEG